MLVRLKSSSSYSPEEDPSLTVDEPAAAAAVELLITEASSQAAGDTDGLSLETASTLPDPGRRTTLPGAAPGVDGWRTRESMGGGKGGGGAETDLRGCLLYTSDAADE